MMKRILMIVFAVMMILPGCQDEKDKAFFTQNNGLAISGYDGTFRGGKCAAVNFDVTPITGRSRYDYYYGIFTFVLPYYFQAASSVSLGLYPVYQNPYDGGNCLRDFAIEFEVYPIIASAEDYAQWENCESVWDSYERTCVKPKDCEIMPAENFTAEPLSLPTTFFVVQQATDGWIILKSQAFLTWLQNNFKEDEGVSFLIRTRVTWLSGENMCGGPYAYPGVQYEDGEDQLGTGNIPYLNFE
jgi:hypothetical protein